MAADRLLNDPPFGDRALVIIAALVTVALALTLLAVACHLVARNIGVSEQEDEDWLL